MSHQDTKRDLAFWDQIAEEIQKTDDNPAWSIEEKYWRMLEEEYGETELAHDDYLDGWLPYEISAATPKGYWLEGYWPEDS